MNDKIIKQIKALPPLPKSVLEVQRITNDPDSSVADLVKVIKNDPMLTANLLKVANSPLYGFARQIKSVDQAVALFGMVPIKGFVISFAIRNSMKFDLSAYGIDENHFHTISTKRNALALNWYAGNREKLDIIATDSFLIDLGAVIISLILVSENKDNEFRQRLTKENRYELEKEFVGATTPEVTAEIFKHWHFGDELIIPIENIDTPENVDSYKEEAAALKVIKTIYDMLDKEFKDNLQKGVEIAQNYNLNTEKLTKVFEKLEG
ncbi:HDOD domain-containing protein [Caminibacter sp.]